MSIEGEHRRFGAATYGVAAFFYVIITLTAGDFYKNVSV
jgi:hypothetical protein